MFHLLKPAGRVAASVLRRLEFEALGRSAGFGRSKHTKQCVKCLRERVLKLNVVSAHDTDGSVSLRVVGKLSERPCECARLGGVVLLLVLIDL